MKNNTLVYLTLMTLLFSCSVFEAEEKIETLNEGIENSKWLIFDSYSSFQDALVEVSNQNNENSKEII